MLLARKLYMENIRFIHVKRYASVNRLDYPVVVFSFVLVNRETAFTQTGSFEGLEIWWPVAAWRSPIPKSVMAGSSKVWFSALSLSLLSLFFFTFSLSLSLCISSVTLHAPRSYRTTNEAVPSLEIPQCRDITITIWHLAFFPSPSLLATNM